MRGTETKNSLQNNIVSVKEFSFLPHYANQQCFPTYATLYDDKIMKIINFCKMSTES
jgi:hypothetical protein